jgi:hypothetical protein
LFTGRRIPVAQGRSIYDALPNHDVSEWMPVAGAGHNDVHQGNKPWSKSVHERMFAFVRKWVS